MEDGQFFAAIYNSKRIYIYEKKPCHTSCATCSGPTATECITCACGYYLSGSSCYDVLDSPCLECSEGSTTNCTVCLTNAYLKVDSLNAGTCSFCNSPGVYIEDDLCLSCSSMCSACTNDPANCTACAVAGEKLFTENSTCGVCPTNAGYFVETVTHCTQCYSSCKTCSGAAATDCLSCYPGRFLTELNKCQPCPTNCTTCVSATECLTCGPSMELFDPEKKCADCIDFVGRYKDGSDCRICDTNCYKCQVSATNCVACSGGLKLSDTNATCTACSGHFFVAANGSCSECDTNCVTCSSFSTQCTSCLSPKILLPDLSCGICGTNTYIDTSVIPNICNPCPSNCSSCSSSTICTSCPANYYLDASNKCDPCTREGVSVFNGVCLDCEFSSICATCGGNTSNCTTCTAANQYLRLDSGNKCTSDCPSTNYYFTNGSVTYCDLCNANCLTCSGSAEFCTSCSAPKILLNDKCAECSEGCVSCLNQSYCQQCAVGRIMTTNYSCVTSCNTAGVAVVGGICTDCSADCKSCFGSAASCTSCIAGQYLSATNTCVPCTENGYYHNSTNCLQCDSSCLTCNGSTSTDCLTCPNELTLVDGSCLDVQPLVLTSAVFRTDMELADFAFDHEIAAENIQELVSSNHISFFDCPADRLLPVLKIGHTSTPLLLDRLPCNKIADWTAKDIEIEGKRLKVRVKGEKGLDKATLVLITPKQGYIRDAANQASIYPEDYLIVENVTVIKSALDGMMDSAAAPAAAAMTTVQTLVMVVSAPQAFILMKVLQTMDYYIYIECNYPSNFAKFLDMITNSAVEFMPNFLEPLTDDDGLPLYERFAEYGMKVHIFANLGQIYSVIIILGALKLLLFLAGRAVKYSRKWHEYVSVEIFFGFFESYNLDSVLSVMIFVAQRERVNHRQDAVKYLVIVFVSLFSLFMISMYLFMGYTVSRLTDSYFKHAIIKMKYMKNEKFRFLLEDKNMHGNIFQRHFNLIQLFKDIVFAALLYALYYKPLVLIILLTLIQAVFMACVFAYPPYNIAWMNNSLKSTQLLYLILDILFLVLIGFGDSMTEHTRYYFLGFGMIAVCIAILACNIGFNVYSTVKELKERCRNYKAKKTAEQSKEANKQISQEDTEYRDISMNRSLTLMQDQSIISNKKSKISNIKAKPNSRIVLKDALILESSTQATGLDAMGNPLAKSSLLLPSSLVQPKTSRLLGRANPMPPSESDATNVNLSDRIINNLVANAEPNKPSNRVFRQKSHRRLKAISSTKSKAV